MKKILVLSITLFIIITSLDSQELFNVDWATGRIFSYIILTTQIDYHFPHNRIKDIESARIQSKANFYRALKNINIYHTDSVFKFFEENIEKNRELYSLIDNAMINKVEYMGINKIKLSYYINIYGEYSIMSILLNDRDIFTEDLKGYMDYHYNTQYTGVIIDARGELISFNGDKVHVVPSLFVVVKDSEGRVVFDQNNVFPGIMREKGMTLFAYDIYNDYKDRVGDNPLKIVASGVGDKVGTNIVISVIDAKRLLSSEKSRNAIQNGKVVIIIDE